ncbi:MAG: beta-ketoacyl-[acyl-carrier-protein] synthase family protein [Deltaproteobacteria bacterium]|nr:beta-ketoacyl-[acyl-carrier-protein] synthase family protein [Deltaproteobacteria bacterium]
MNKEQQKDSAQRVVVTGIGMVTPLGIGREEFGRRLFSGETAIAEIKTFDTSTFGSHLGAEVTNFNPRDFISVKNMRRMDKTSLMTAASARMALDDAGIQITQENRDRVGIILGTAFGATDVTAQVAGTLLTEGPSSVNPILVPNIVMNAPAGHTSIELGFRGVNTTVTHFAVSAENAIAYAAAEIRRGTADFILAGGVDILSKFYYESLTKFHALSPQNGGPEACRPFDKDRNGTVVGEGCGIICLESMESAKARGRKPYCEIKGIGMGSSPTTPTGWPQNSDGIKRTLGRALKNAGSSINDIQAIFAAANGGRILDAVEADAYAEIFADSKNKTLITALKGATGESFSGGGIRACALALSMEKNMLPPAMGLTNPLRPLEFVIGDKKEIEINNIALAGISFGGTYAYLIFGK